MVVGYAPDGRGRAVLHLAGMLARSAGDDLVLCAVVPAAWPPSPARVDAEYRDHVEREAADVLERARERVGDDVQATTLVHHARSVPAGLLEVAEQRDAVLLVTGAAGSTTNRLLHGSPVPVALAPRGFRAGRDARVARVTAAFGGGEADLVVAAAGLAARVGATLRIASFAVRPRAPYTAGVGRSADEAAVREWTGEIEAAQRAALERVAGLQPVPDDAEAVVGRGETWEEALDDVEWDAGDVVVLGSSSTGPIARVFLGSRATKIVEHAPVPVVLVPRGAVAERASETAT